MYQATFLDLPRSGYKIRQIDFSHCATDTKDTLAKKVDRLTMTAIKRQRSTKCVLWSIEASPPCMHRFSLQRPDSRLYELTLEVFEIPNVQVRPAIISADAAYDARGIRQYNRKREIKSDIPVNRRSRRHPKRGRPLWLTPEFYKESSAVERFSVGSRHSRR